MLIVIILGFYRYQNYFFEFLGSGTYSIDLVANTLYTASTYSQIDFNNSLHALISVVWRFVFSLIFVLVISNSIRYSDNQCQNVVNRRILSFMMVILIISLGMIFILGNNGLRYIGIINLIGCILLENNKVDFCGFLRWRISLKSLILLIGNLGCCVLYLYDMSWGTGSLKSFIWSSITGYISRFLS